VLAQKGAEGSETMKMTIYAVCDAYLGCDLTEQVEVKVI